MSYFNCEFGVRRQIHDNFLKILQELVPLQKRDTILQKKNQHVGFVTIGYEKVLQDILIQDSQTGSWMALVGTPLLSPEFRQDGLALLASFLKNPARSLKNDIHGSFAIFAYDDYKKQLIVASDFNVTIPVFYSFGTDSIVFSSHELALARSLNAEIDPFGFSQVINIGAVWRSFSKYKGIRKILPNQILILQEDLKISEELYWKPDDEQSFKGSFTDCTENWNQLLKNTITKYYESSGRQSLMCDFTAGEDSRLIISTCHSLGIPIKTQVMGEPDSVDVTIAKSAAAKLGIDIVQREKLKISEKQLLNNALDIVLISDAHQGFFTACSEFATELASPIDDYEVVKLCGVPGGEAFRGSYYLRGKVIFPSLKSRLDYPFFTKMKWLLDFHPGLLKIPDSDFLGRIDGIVKESLSEAEGFSLGIQIDHLLRHFQTCNLGLRYKNPLYLPFASNDMTRSIYSLPAQFKQGGKLTKACTEMLYPELAIIKNQNGVPTIRKTLSRTLLFMPEYLATVRKVYSGAISRLFKLTQANKWYFSLDWNAQVFTTLFNKPPYCTWFSSIDNMATGHLYNADVLSPILTQAKAGACRYVPILDRVIAQELAFRWVSGNGVSEMKGVHE